MNDMGKMRFKWELEKFVITRLRSNLYFDFLKYEEDIIEERFWVMDKMLEHYEYRRKLVDYPQLTNHEICHEMFWNAIRGRSKLFIQIQDLRYDEYAFPEKSDDIVVNNVMDVASDKEVITLQCSLLTLQMLDYDTMMFRAMSEAEDEEYRNAANSSIARIFLALLQKLVKKNIVNYRYYKETRQKLYRFS